jgi:putative drug exporter of the RND superfamily
VLERWTRAVIRWRVVVVGAWIIIVVLGALASSRLPALLTTSLSVPGSSSAAANDILVRHFGDNVEGTFTVVVSPVHSGASLARDERAIAAAARAIPGATVTQERLTFGVLYANVTTTESLAVASGQTPTLRAALRAQGVAGALVTGPPALQHDLTPILQSDLKRGEITALLVALALLIVVLGLSGSLVVPFAVAAGTVAGALGLVYLLAHSLAMVLYVPNVVELIGLGLAVDYSLLVVHRYRAEAQTGDLEGALLRTMASAGRTVLWSGLTVALGVCALLLVPVPFVRSLGVAALCVPLAAVAAALTLQPALLSLLPRRWLRAVGPRGLLDPDLTGGLWSRVTRFVVRRPAPLLLAATVGLGGCAVGLAWLQVTPASETAVPRAVESARALELVRARLGPGVATPIEVVIDTGRAHDATSRGQSRARLHLAEAILRDPDVVIVAIGAKSPYVDVTRRYAQIFVVARGGFGSATTLALVHHLRHDLIPRARFPAGTTISLGGAPSQGADFLNAVYGSFPLIILLTLVLALGVLTRAFRSLSLALVAVGLDLVSVVAAYGLVVDVFRTGVGARLLGTYHVSQIEGWVPVFIFAVLIGLSSDYEVFIVSRIREARDAGASTVDAIAEGLARTGAVVSAAALIMIGALTGLIVGRIAGLQELGVGLSLGILLDATLVRGVVLPSVLVLLGERTWWLPRPVRRLLRLAAPPDSGTATSLPTAT